MSMPTHLQTIKECLLKEALTCTGATSVSSAGAIPSTGAGFTWQHEQEFKLIPMYTSVSLSDCLFNIYCMFSYKRNTHQFFWALWTVAERAYRRATEDRCKEQDENNCSLHSHNVYLKRERFQQNDVNWRYKLCWKLYSMLATFNTLLNWKCDPFFSITAEMPGWEAIRLSLTANCLWSPAL